MKSMGRGWGWVGWAGAVIGLIVGGPVGVAQTTETEKSPVILGIGEQRLWALPEGIAKFAVGGPAIRAASVQAKTLVIRGAGVGTADLRVWKQDGTTEHRTFQVERVPPSLGLPAALVRGLSGLQETEVWAWAQGGIILRGEIQSLAEAARVHGLAQLYPKEIHDETQPSASLVHLGQSRLGDWLLAHPELSSLTCERQGRDLWVRGHVATPMRAASLRKQLVSLYPPVLLELDSLPDSDPTVHFQVFLLEVKKNRLRSLGLDWPVTQESAFRVTSSSLQEALNLDVALQALEADGAVRILSNPELVVRAPGEAELFAGGELPVSTRTRVSSQLNWKNFGLTLRLKVGQSAGARVRLEIWTEVSHLDPSISRGETPGIQANRMRTQVDARYGSPLLLSGLLQDHWRRNARGLPWLRDLPILGALFGSEDFIEERSELVAVLLPRSAPPAQPMTRLTHLLPHGPIPHARQWISPAEEIRLRASTEWPWNALE
jgi:pilus assembly protein CpaC